MAIKVIILRRVPPGSETQLAPLLEQLRAICLKQPGYLSGETLVSADDPSEYLVLSSWENRASWDRWAASGERAALQQQIDALLGTETVYQVYHNV